MEFLTDEMLLCFLYICENPTRYHLRLRSPAPSSKLSSPFGEGGRSEGEREKERERERERERREKGKKGGG